MDNLSKDLIMAENGRFRILLRNYALREDFYIYERYQGTLNSDEVVLEREAGRD